MIRSIITPASRRREWNTRTRIADVQARHQRARARIARDLERIKSRRATPVINTGLQPGAADTNNFGTVSTVPQTTKTKGNKMPVRAKFRVATKSDPDSEGGVSNVTLNPVIEGSQENKDFFKWTPSGQITIGTINQAAAEQFEIGKEYYVDFTPA